MRARSTCVSIVLATGLAVSVVGCSEAEAPATPSASDETRAGTAPAEATSPVVLDERPAAAASDGLQPFFGGDQNSAARRWVLENREINDDTDRLYAEVEATMLELLDDLLSGEELEVGSMIGFMSMMQGAERAADANLDGVIDDEERARAESFFDFENNPAGHPYLAARFDTDGDGVLSPEEEAAAEAGFQNMAMSAFQPAMELMSLHTLDADGDGFVTDAERAAAGDGARDFDGDGEISDGERQMAAMSTVGPVMMRVMSAVEGDGGGIGGPDSDLSMDQFDFDGDGEYSDDEVDAFREARSAEIQTWREQYEQARLERDLNQNDLNSDGVIDLDERRLAINASRQRGNEALVMVRYDGDGDGAIGQTELQDFTRWYRDGAPRADANADGVVDASDLQLMMELAARR